MPVTGTPIRKMDFMIRLLALAEPVPLTLAKRSTHRCEAKDYTQVRPNGKMGRGWINRTTRCTSKETSRAVLDPRCCHYQTYVARGEIEIREDRIAITVTRPADVYDFMAGAA